MARTRNYPSGAVDRLSQAEEPEWGKLPPLRAGDRMSRYEFERRYEQMPKSQKAELIEGVVYIPSPVHFETHGEPHAFVVGWLALYCSSTPGVRLGDNATLRLDQDNEVQPDAMLFFDPVLGRNQLRISDDDFVEGAPELIVEIAASSASYDLHDKLHVYRRNGVQEYVVWLVHEQEVRWFRLHHSEYVLETMDEQGRIRSRMFPGLWLQVTFLLSGDLGAVLATLQDGMRTDEYVHFATELGDDRGKMSQ